MRDTSTASCAPSPRAVLLALAIGLGGAHLGACKVINPDHCANQALPGNAWCENLSQSAPFCSPCVAAFHGCVAFEPIACAEYVPPFLGGGDGQGSDGGTGSSGGTPLPTTAAADLDSGPDDGTTSMAVDDTASADGTTAAMGTTAGDGTDAGTTVTDEGPASTDSSDGGTMPATLPYSEDFAGADGLFWPAPWNEGGTAVLSSELDGGRGRVSGQTGTVGRMRLPGFEEVDVDVTVVMEFESASQQGFGFYVRQNGGVLDQTATLGQGYAVYVEGDGTEALGVWRELDGVEGVLAQALNPIAGGLQDDTAYRIRFQCEQNGGTTTLRAKMWLDGNPQPAAWQVQHNDGAAVLQNTPGSFAVDVYNYAGVGSIFVHDLQIVAL